MKIQEHEMILEGDPLRIKIIAEALSEYVQKHNLTDDTTLCDFNFNMEAAYQSEYSLDQDDWDYTAEHKVELGNNMRLQ